jgi:galactosamine-6-phosphate isomerase
MKLVVADTYDDSSRQIADAIISSVKDAANPLLCVASGDSPKGAYRELVNRFHQNELHVANWYFVALDEWLGMNGTDEGSCRYHLDQQLFYPLQIAEEKICFFDGRTKDLAAECKRVESFIKEQDGIDVAIVGLGMNGHVGMNEPGTPPDLHAHVATLDSVTQQVGQKYFKQQQQLSGGLTLGVANLMEARKLFLVVNGRHKAEVVQKLLSGPVSEQLPASFLLRHPNLSIYLDKEAAALIKSESYAS